MNNTQQDMDLLLNRIEELERSININKVQIDELTDKVKGIIQNLQDATNRNEGTITNKMLELNSVVRSYNNNISEATKDISALSDNIKKLDCDVLEKLKEINTVNDKMVIAFENLINSKAEAIVGDIRRENLRMINDNKAIRDDIVKDGVEIRKDLKQIIQAGINEENEGIYKSIEKQRIGFYIIGILVVIDILLRFIL